jgi:subtilisin family serine protease
MIRAPLLLDYPAAQNKILQYSVFSNKIVFALESSTTDFPFTDRICENSLVGESFAMLSGTSMAAPHVAGLAALIKQKFPSFSPAAIASALSTTTTLSDRQGKPIMAQRTYSNPDSTQSPATAFDMGNGFVNATAALDPGLVFDCSKFCSHLHFDHFKKQKYLSVQNGRFYIYTANL